MPLANPTPVRLAQDQLQWLDSWRGDRLSRGAAIRQLIDRMMRLQQADDSQSESERA